MVRYLWRLILKSLMILLSILMQVVGLYYTGTFFRYSLFYRSSVRFYDKNSRLSKKIKKTKAFKTELSNIIKELEVEGINLVNRFGDLQFNKENSSIDLYLSIHNTRYFLALHKKDDIWTIMMEINDVYNFEPWQRVNRINKMLHNVVVFVNNLASKAQENSLIQPYKLRISIEERIMMK